MYFWVFFQGTPGDRGERGESGDPGYKVGTVTLTAPEIIHSGSCGLYSVALSQGQVGLDGGRGRSGALGLPVSINTRDFLRKQTAGMLT